MVDVRDVAVYELRYLLVLTRPSLQDVLLEECAPYQARQVVPDRSVVSVFEITSPRRYETLSPSAHDVIESDLQHMRSECAFFGESFLEYRGDVVGQRWPVLVETGRSGPTGPDVVEFEASWNNMILRAADADLADRLIDVAGHCLATFYLLRTLDDLATDLARSLLAETGDQPGDSVWMADWATRREQALSALVLAEPRRRIYWGCERRLYEVIRDQWGLAELTEAVDRSTAGLTEAVRDRTLRISALQNAASARAARRAAVGLLLLTVISGVSAITALVEFGVSEGEPNAVVWRLVLSGVLLVIAVVLIVANRQSLRAGPGGVADIERGP